MNTTPDQLARWRREVEQWRNAPPEYRFCLTPQDAIGLLDDMRNLLAAREFSVRMISQLAARVNELGGEAG